MVDAGAGVVPKHDAEHDRRRAAKQSAEILLDRPEEHPEADHEKGDDYRDAVDCLVEAPEARGGFHREDIPAQHCFQMEHERREIA